MSKILKSATTDCFYGPFTHNSTSQFIGWITKSYVLTVFKNQIVRTSHSGSEAITTHFSCVLVIAVHLVKTVNVFEKEVCDGRVVTCMLTVELTPIWKCALMCLPQQRIKWLFLSYAHINTTHSKCNC